MKRIQDKPGGRPAKKRTEKQKKVVSTKLTELQYYAIRKDFDALNKNDM